MTQMPDDPVKIARALCNAGNDFEAYDNGSARPEFWARVANLVLSWREAWGGPRLRPTSEKPSVGAWISVRVEYVAGKFHWGTWRWRENDKFSADMKGWILLEEPPRKSVKERAADLANDFRGTPIRHSISDDATVEWVTKARALLREIAEAPSDGPSSHE